jgi:tRNA threonylcarbamoyladenosine biosynthesis protein TsaB
MIALAMDTSGDEASVALVRDDSDGREVLASEVLSSGMRHGVELFPALERLLKGASVPPRGVALVAVGLGPGSYTGLRVGITAARAFAYATGAELLGVPSCDAWAAASPPSARPLAVVLDARTRAVYLAIYESTPEGWSRRSGPELLDPGIAASRIPADATLVGDGVAAYASAFAGRASAASPSRADASEVAGLALRRFARGEHDAIEAVVPLYLRRPDAEIKREAALAKDRSKEGRSDG